jgi:hypothetical protein
MKISSFNLYSIGNDDDGLDINVIVAEEHPKRYFYYSFFIIILITNEHFGRCE